jgi:hypothetical protein
MSNRIVSRPDHLVNTFGQKIPVGSKIVYVPTHSWGQPRVGLLKEVVETKYDNNYTHRAIIIQGVNGSPQRFVYNPGGKSGYVDMKPYAYTREITSKTVFLLDTFDFSNVDESVRKDIEFLNSLDVTPSP